MPPTITPRTPPMSTFSEPRHQHGHSIEELFRLAQLSDSALPVGGFSFSCGLEAAVAEGMVDDARTLGAYTRAVVRVAAECDAVAMLHAYRSATEGYLDQLVVCDKRLASFKLSAEARTMSLRMGGMLTRLLHDMVPDCNVAEVWWQWVNEERTVGTYAVAEAVAGVALGLSEEETFAALLYGTASSVLGAALRCMRLSHIHTQQIMTKLAPLCGELYNAVRSHTLEEMRSFAPLLDVAAAMHEKGSGRLFMN